MNMQPVCSTNLAAVGYDEISNTLCIRFRQGGTYAYSGVPKNIYDNLMCASSKGSYHAAFIKHSFPYHRIG